MTAAPLPAPLTSALHNHCIFCDGKNTLAEMAAAAFAAGFSGIGFSSHSAAAYPPYTGLGDAQIDAYLAAIGAFKQEYQGKMKIWAGVEQDFYGPVSFRDKLDYCIAAVHDIYDARTGKFYFTDGGAPVLQACIDEMFGGDALALVRHFYALTVECAHKYKPDIIGHFDLVIKNNVNGNLFDESGVAYQKIALEALHACADTGAVFEVNTGGMYRGYRNVPYPARFLLEALQKRGARVTVSADAHNVQAITYQFAEVLNLLRSVGFSHVSVWENDGFVQKAL